MLFPLKLPPGVARNGTEYSTKGRYYDAYLIRWTDDGTLLPVGGWRTRSSASALTGKARCLFSWKDNGQLVWGGIGTSSHLYVTDRAGNVTDITPAGFVSGRDDASTGGGYGGGTYGTGYNYGSPTPDTTNILDATQWTGDNWGQLPVFVSPDDNKIYTWDLNVAHLATQVTNSPTCNALVVTPERFLFALGSTDPRTVQWCDQGNNTVWTPSVTNQAGSFPLQTGGRLLLGKSSRGLTFLLTDIDAWAAVYVGGTLVYGFEKLASGCGGVSRQCAAQIDTKVAWMGRAEFWLYDGYVRPIPCEVRDLIFDNINILQISKVYAVRDSANSEIAWHYPSGGSVEVDSVVVWNYKFNYWVIGRKPRTCGTDRGLFQYPIHVGTDGFIYDHEVGFTYDGTFPFAEGGPLEFSGGFRGGLAGEIGIGSGDTVLYANWLLPDDKTLGDVNAEFKVKFDPDDTEVIVGPYTLAARTDVRFCARQIKVRYTGVSNDDWRVGIPRLDATQGGQR